ncbi:MAG: hypothetical protein ACM3MK_09195 [Chitinophagales bacterium]
MQAVENMANTFEMMVSYNQRLWDLWMTNLGSLSWLNEKSEKIMQDFMGQAKTVWQENARVFQEMMNNCRQNQDSIREMYKDAMVFMADNLRFSSKP